MFSSWSEYRRGKLSKPDVLLFDRHLEDNVFSLHAELKAQTYRHGLYQIFHIRDPKHRVINKATVKDRLVHHLVFRELERIYEPCFIYHSYSSRVGRGTHLAVKNLARCLRQVSCNYARKAFVLKCDVKKFFDSVAHQKLLELIQSKVKDDDFMWLIREIVTSFTVDETPQRERVKGLFSSKNRHADWQYNFTSFC